MSHSMLTAMGASTDHGGNRSFRNKKAPNMHGSFLEGNNAANHSNRLSIGPTLSSSKRVSISVTPLKKTPYKAPPNVFVTDTEKGSQQNIAKQVEFEQAEPEIVQDDSSKTTKPCTSCGQQFKPEEPVPKDTVKEGPVKTENEIVAQFDLKILDYSPTKKCAQFIEENNFVSSGSAANTPEHHQQQQQQFMQISSAKKGSLLAKAIANNKNANDKANMSIDEMSIASSSSTTSDQIKANSYLSASTLSHVNVSEFEGEEMCGTCKETPTTVQEKEPAVAMATNANIKVEEMCDENKLASSGHPETNEVSLINMTTDACDEDDGHHTEDEYVDFSTAHINASKRKMTVEYEDLLNNGDNDENRRPSVILQSNLTTLNENQEETSEKSKKFKNQVTSTPAASKINKLGAININTNVDSPRLGKPSPTESIDGLFFGRGRHTDGSLIRIFYQRKLVKIANESDDHLICVWISRDPYADRSMLECSMDQSQVS